MKNILKTLAIILIITLSITLIPNVNAAKVTSSKYDDIGKITITNAEKGEDYKIYQILELESYDTTKEAYTYKVNASSKWYAFLKNGEGKNYVNVEDNTNIVTWKDGADVKDFAEKALDYATTNSIAETAKETATSETVEFSTLYLGYYLVDSSLGFLCNLTTTNNEIEILEKNGVPTITKEVMEDSSESFGNKNQDEIGSVVNFKTTIDVKNGANNYVLYDVMDEGLTLDEESITVTLKETDKEDKVLVKGTDYTVSTTTEGYTFVIDFTKALEKTLSKNNDIEVTYSATINEKAVINGVGNKNETYLGYGDKSKTTTVETRTYTFEFDLIKINNKNEELTGAKFELYTAAKNGTKINLIDLGNNTYRVATTDEASAEGFESAVITAGNAKIQGLDDDSSYYLEEIEAPNGYNKLTSRVEVKLNSSFDNKNESTVTVSGAESNTIIYANSLVSIINITGALLPSTGGIGTTIFTVVGSALVLGLGILLVARFVASKND